MVNMVNIIMLDVSVFALLLWATSMAVERPAREHLVQSPPDGHHAEWADLETAGEERPGQKTVADCGQRPVLHGKEQ